MLDVFGGLQPERHGTVVHQGNLHVRPESTGGDLWMAGACEYAQMFEQTRRLGGFGRGAETRPIPLARIGCEGELRHQQLATPGVAQRPVHAPLGIGKHPVGEQALQ